MRMIEFDKARRTMLKELEGRIGSIGALRIIGALEDITIEAEPVVQCGECRWKGRRHQKCSCCRRNRYLKDCYEEG